MWTAATGLFGLDQRSFAGGRRIKFSRIIAPGTELRLELKLREAALSFGIRSPAGDQLYASGTIALAPEGAEA